MNGIESIGGDNMMVHTNYDFAVVGVLLFRKSDDCFGKNGKTRP